MQNTLTVIIKFYLKFYLKLSQALSIIHHRALCVHIVFHYRQIENIIIVKIGKKYLGVQFTGTLCRLVYDYGSRINLYVICCTIGI